LLYTGEYVNKQIINILTTHPLIKLYHHPCFAKAYESYLNKNYNKCLSSLKYDNTSGDINHSDYGSVNIIGVEEPQIEPNVNIQTDSLDTYHVGKQLLLVTHPHLICLTVLIVFF